MNALQLIRTVIENGGKLWSIDGMLHYDAPASIINPLLPELKRHKQEILEILEVKPKSKIRIYKVRVDGKLITAIDPTNKSVSDFIDTVEKRFGRHRVQNVRRVLH